MQKHPELLDMLQGPLKLFIVAEHHVEYLLVLALPVNEPLQALARHFNFLPDMFSSLFSDFLVALRIIQK